MSEGNPDLDLYLERKRIEIKEYHVESKLAYWEVVGEIPYFDDDKRTRQHMVELVYSVLEENGPSMDWEIVETTKKPLFRVSHALMLLSGEEEDPCPYVMGPEECMRFPESPVRRVDLPDPKKEYRRYLDKRKKT